MSIVGSIAQVFAKGSIRGLRNFITECLDCQSKEEERARVRKELGNILKNFQAGQLNGYNRKKYVAKLLYIHLLGYSFDFGFPQMIELLASNVFSEKQIGYITLGVYLNGNYELVSLLIEHLRREMKNVENEPAQCLALAAAANIGGTEIAETLAPSILQVLASPKSTEFVRKKAALALVRLYRENPSTFVYSEATGRLLLGLLQDPNFGVQLSGTNLIIILMNRFSADLQAVFPVALQQLTKIFFEFNVPTDYQYGRCPVPWLVTRYLRILQYKQSWEPEEITKISRVIDVCLQKTDLMLTVKEVNSNLMLLFEAINLIVATHLTSQFLSKSATILGGFLSAKQSNVRYMSLEALTRLVSAAPDVIPSLNKHRQTLFQALRDPDNSIRRRALSLLYVMCTPESAEEIVAELLNYLKFADLSMREPLCLKIAVLAESFMTDLAWYVDTILSLITLAGDECHDGVWHRVVQVISMNPQYQRYATLTSFNSMTSSTAHDRLVRLAAQLSGEYAHLIPNPPEEVVSELLKKYSLVTPTTQAMIISAVAKIGGRYQPVRQKVAEFLAPLRASQNLEIQQRSIEYSALLAQHQNLLQIVFKPIPPFDPRKSSLISIIDKDHFASLVDDEEEAEKSDGDDAVLATTVSVQAPVSSPPPAASPPPQAVPQPAPVQQPPPQQQRGPPQPAPVQTPDLLGAGAKAPVPSPSPSSGQASSLMDIMAQPVAKPGEDLLSAFNTPGPAPLSNKEAVFKRFLTNDQGVAFEDTLVQLNLTIQSNGPNALLTFIVSNKTSQNLSNIKLHVLPVPFFRANSKPGPPVLGPQGSGTHQFAFTLLAPYTDPPNYIFSYNDVREQLKLPLVITKFMGQFPMNQQVFFQRWGQFSNSNQIAKISYPVTPGVDPTQQMSSLMVALLKVPVLPLELPPYNVCGAGVVTSEAGPHGLLVRFFADGATQQVVVEVRGTSPQITSAIKKIMEIQFS